MLCSTIVFVVCQSSSTYTILLVRIYNESVVNKSKSREYTRELKEKEIKNLQNKYTSHVNSSRYGFLNKKQKEKLLKITKWGRDTTNREITDFYYEVREGAALAIQDLQLLCETLNEDQLEKIFLTKDTLYYLNRKIETINYPITQLMESLIPHQIFAVPQTKTFMQQHMKEKQWRKLILEDLVIGSLSWYFHSGLFKTNAQKHLLFDTIDAIQVNSSGKKEFDLRHDLGKEMSIVKF